MTEKKSILIFNDNSEFKSFKKIIQKKKDLLHENILLIDRRQKEECNEIDNNNLKEEFDILFFHTSQKWSEFLLSAKKISEFLLGSFEIDSLYIFYNYDPLAAILINSIPDINLNLILQRPELEMKMDTKYLMARIKGYIKTFSFFLVTKKSCSFVYRESIHNFLISSKTKINFIRMYPNKVRNLFKFGKIFVNDITSLAKPVFVSSNNYIHPSVDFDEYLIETINFIKKNKIEYFSFHPRESIFFKKSIKENFPKIYTFDGFNLDDYPFKPDVVSISSQVCFDLLIDGYNVAFVPDYFPSTYSALWISLLRDYLKELDK